MFEWLAEVFIDLVNRSIAASWLVLAVLVLILMLRRSAPLAGWLMVPYLVFMLYAGYLNYAIILLT